MWTQACFRVCQRRRNTFRPIRPKPLIPTFILASELRLMNSPTGIVAKLLKRIETAVFADRYFPFQEEIGTWNRLKLLWKYWFHPRTEATKAHEIIFFLYSRACERMLLPLAIDLLKRPELKQSGVRIRVIVIEQIFQLSLTAPNVKQLNDLNCEIETDHLGLIHACHQPEGKLVVLCLDQRKQYRYHYCGVDSADTLR